MLPFSPFIVTAARKVGHTVSVVSLWQPAYLPGFVPPDIALHSFEHNKVITKKLSYLYHVKTVFVMFASVKSDVL